MCPKRFVVSLGLLISLAGGVMADGLIYQLPADGASAVYEMKARNDKQDKDYEGSLTISSVGQTEKDGAKGRWLEVKFIMDNESGTEQVILSKIHVLEKFLKKGESPYDNFTKLWVKMSDQEPVQVTDVKDQRVGPLPAFLGGPLTDVKKLPAVKTKSVLGELNCEGLRGKTNLETNREQVSIEMEHRLHKRSPFGVVASTMKFEVEIDGETRESGHVLLTLKEVNMNARSELPDVE